MNKIIQHITQPLPFIKSQWQTVLFPTLWILLLTVILRPMGFEAQGNKIWIVIGYTATAAASCSIVIYGFPLLFKTYFSPNNFTQGKFYLACFSIIAIATCIGCIVSYFLILSDNGEIRYSILERICFWFSIITFVALFPILIIYASLKNSRLKIIQQNLENSHKYETSLLEDENEDSIILGKNSRAPLSISLDKLLYVEALGNYVTAYYIKNDNVKYKQFRETLIQIADELKDYPQIVRCHRSFIVNIENVTQAKNTQSNKLIINASNTKIPISRSYTKEVREKFSN